MPVIEAVAHLGGLQAQDPNDPYVGLWSRLVGFDPLSLALAIEERQTVRMALMRATLHLVTAADALAFRLPLQPVLDRGLQGAFGARLAGIDAAELAAAGRALVEEAPHTASELGALLAERWPDRDPAALASAIRTWVPLVQVPPRGLWGRSGLAAHTSIEAWLGRPIATVATPDTLVLRYLQAFGPATLRDIQAWSGLTRLAPVLARLRPNLLTFRDENGRELFDLPDAPRPAPDLPAPPRFLAAFDNMLLSYADRTRILPMEHRAAVFTQNGLIRPTFLLDGRVQGLWKINRETAHPTLLIETFSPLTKADRAALGEEAAGLLRFLSGESGDVRFQPYAKR